MADGNGLVLGCLLTTWHRGPAVSTVEERLVLPALPERWRYRVRLLNWSLLILLVVYAMLAPSHGGILGSEKVDAAVGCVLFASAASANLAAFVFSRKRKFSALAVGIVWASLLTVTAYARSGYRWSRTLRYDDSPYDRSRAALMLLARDSATYLPLVHEALREDPSPEARYWIAHDLCRCRPQDYNVLVEAFASETDAGVRDHLVGDLAQVYERDPETIIPLIISTLTDSEVRARSWAPKRLQLIAEDLHTTAPETPGAFELEEGIESQHIWEEWWRDLQAREAPSVTTP